MNTQTQDPASEEQSEVDRFFARQRSEIMANILAEKRRLSERWSVIGLLAASLVVGALALMALVQPPQDKPQIYASWLSELAVASGDLTTDPLEAFGSWQLAATDSGEQARFMGDPFEATTLLPPIFTSERFFVDFDGFTDGFEGLEPEDGSSDSSLSEDSLAKPIPAADSRNQG